MEQKSNQERAIENLETDVIENPTLWEVLKSDFLVLVLRYYVVAMRPIFYGALFVIALMLFVRLFRVVQAFLA